ncbi:hypothetical protein D918_05416 [Trichuris suis]|nr:hypothetical protein D918_05416 [Trichuris suis]
MEVICTSMHLQRPSATPAAVVVEYGSQGRSNCAQQNVSACPEWAEPMSGSKSLRGHDFSSRKPHCVAQGIDYSLANEIQKRVLVARRVFKQFALQDFSFFGSRLDGLVMI